jgi:drug/metabolite transporter (DMT)-like permease
MTLQSGASGKRPQLYRSPAVISAILFLGAGLWLGVDRDFGIFVIGLLVLPCLFVITVVFMIAAAFRKAGRPAALAASAGVFINIEPLMGSILGVGLFGDKLTVLLAAGGLAIIAGSLLVVLGERSAPVAEMNLPPPIG